MERETSKSRILLNKFKQRVQVTGGDRLEADWYRPKADMPAKATGTFYRHVPYHR